MRQPGRVFRRRRLERFRYRYDLDGSALTVRGESDGRPLFALALHGVMISALEDEGRAKR